MTDSKDRRPQRKPPLLVFVHIPKTAGTTMRRVLEMNEPGTRTRALGNVFKGGGGLSKDLITRFSSGEGPDLRGVKLLRGHFPLGIRDYLPKYLPKNREMRFFTILREPVDRTISHYFQVREYEGSHQLPPLPADATLDAALERGYLHDNLHTRMLSGLPDPFDEVTEEMLEQAKLNLRDELACFGLTERFDESLVLAKRRLGFRAILYRTSGRVNAARPRGGEIPETLLDAAQRCNRYDIELYSYARELFDSSPEMQDLDFEIELAALRAAKADGELELAAPVPESFGGDEETWKMLLEARATAQRLEWERGSGRITAIATAARVETLKETLLDARETVKELEQEVERLRADAGKRARNLKQKNERLKEMRSRVRELEQEVARPDGASPEAEEENEEAAPELA